MSKNNKKYQLPVGTEFTYRNQKYVVACEKNCFPCTACEEANAQHIENNPHMCVALTKTGTKKFRCEYKCDPCCYPKRIK